MNPIKVSKDAILGIADLMIFAAEVMHEAADIMGEAEASTKTTLKSSGKTYEVKIIVSQVENDKEE